MDKIKARHQDLQQALDRLKEAVDLPPEQIYQDATIQRFEFTFELCWKLMQSIASYHGVDHYGPRNAIRSAAQLNLIDDPETWINYLTDRNLTTHLYRQSVAEEIYHRIPEFIPLVEKLLHKATNPESPTPTN